ncbi:alpha/beta hydrolase-fold protein [Myxococcota bacterium]|nr:alpha/beta hydrolase-fold protein [Myxococcota bacterium]
MSTPFIGLTFRNTSNQTKKDRGIWAAIVYALPLSLLVASLAQAATTTTIDIQSAGRSRQFIAYVPTSYDPAKPTPLLFMMHGLLSSASIAARPFGPYRWQTLAEQESFIVLFPNSYQDDSWDMNSADANFVRDMISWSIENYNIKRTHIFSTGHSMGAFFSYYVATQLRNDLNPISVFAAHSGGIVSGLWPTTVPSSPPQLRGMILHSPADSVVPYSWSTDLHSALLDKGHVSELVTLANSLDHNWDRASNATQWEFFLAQAPLDPAPPPPPPVPSIGPAGITVLVALMVAGTIPRSFRSVSH